MATMTSIVTDATPATPATTTTLRLRPTCRMQQPGSKAHFRVRFDGPGGRTLMVRACDDADAVSYKAHFANEDESVPAGGEQQLEVEVPPHASMA